MATHARRPSALHLPAPCRRPRRRPSAHGPRRDRHCLRNRHQQQRLATTRPHERNRRPPRRPSGCLLPHETLRRLRHPPRRSPWYPARQCGHHRRRHRRRKRRPHGTRHGRQRHHCRHQHQPAAPIGLPIRPPPENPHVQRIQRRRRGSRRGPSGRIRPHPRRSHPQTCHPAHDRRHAQRLRAGRYCH